MSYISFLILLLINVIGCICATAVLAKGKTDSLLRTLLLTGVASFFVPPLGWLICIYFAFKKPN
ncbi:hypothetical protein [Planctobacterium marinum]|uniref:Uncharacterized protein n=1 Tax=Planctobacterium marinum TaxID=1631968 RepID=A0AA48HHW8_9ALTE|nr:hypothetical protein MACH26_22320 [Planctobacterium marinum]